MVECISQIFTDLASNFHQFANYHFIGIILTAREYSPFNGRASLRVIWHVCICGAYYRDIYVLAGQFHDDSFNLFGFDFPFQQRRAIL